MKISKTKIFTVLTLLCIHAMFLDLKTSHAGNNNPSYSIDDLENLPGAYYCIPTDMNDSEQVVGYCGGYSNTNDYVLFLSTGNKMIEIDRGIALIGAYRPRINNSGNIAYTKPIPHPINSSNYIMSIFLYKNGTTTNVGNVITYSQDVPLYWDCQSADINDSDVIVGDCDGEGFAYANGQFSPIKGGIFANLEQGLIPISINKSGTIIGNFGYYIDTVPYTWIYDNQTIIKFCSLPGLDDNSCHSSLTAINSTGWIVGVSNNTSFLYKNGEYTNIGRQFAPDSLNDLGQIIGTSNEYGPMVYIDGSSYALKDISTHNSQIGLSTAVKINNNGVIVGSAGNGYRVFIARPKKPNPVQVIDLLLNN